MPYQTNNRYFKLKLLLLLVICVGGGWLTGFLTETSVQAWYPSLIKPAWTPPNVVFPIAWTILYICMAVAATLVWASKTGQKAPAFIAFGVQLFLNFIWSFLFFYLENPLLALVDIILLWLAVLITIGIFWRHSRAAAYLLIPYLIWVSYAFCLNLFIWIHN